MKCESEYESLETLWQSRKSDQLAPLLNFEGSAAILDHRILLSANDWGVWRNSGRRGAALGPQSILAQLKKMSSHKVMWKADVRHCWPQEKNNFSSAQHQSRDLITAHLQGSWRRLIHLGGGHDHIYPLVQALRANGQQKIHILNLDAHLDSRTDPIFHSGTPMRQLDDEDLVIDQIGVQSFANSSSTLSPLEKGKMRLHSFNQLAHHSHYFRHSLTEYWKESIKPDPSACVIFSLDCDALAAETMSAVSAVNPWGLPLVAFYDLLNFYLSLAGSQKIMGIYEFNPIYDDVSAKGAKLISAFCYEFFRGHI